MRASTRPVRTMAAVAATIALALSACGGDDDSQAEPPAASEPAEEPVAEPAEGATITIADFAFSGVTEVAVGTTVVVTNEDSTQHTWSATGGAFDSGALGSGDSFEFTFTEPGTYEYQCNFHPSMTGTIVVTG